MTGSQREWKTDRQKNLNNEDRGCYSRELRSRFLIALFSCGSMQSWCRERHDPLFNEGELPLMLGLRVNQTLHHTNIFCRPLYLQGPNHNTRTPPAPREREGLLHDNFEAAPIFNTGKFTLRICFSWQSDNIQG